MLEKAGLSAIAEDSAITDIPHTDLCLVSNLDIMTPIVDDPFLFGQITTCNATNDVFALNVPDVLSYVVFMGIPTDIPEDFPVAIMKGIKSFMESIDSEVSGGHTVYSEWPLLGGTANGVIQKDLLIRKAGANTLQKGDKILITKPQGIQPAMAVYRIREEDEFGILDGFEPQAIEELIQMAIKSMTTSNRDVVQAIHSYKLTPFIRTMTDITGFGLKGHLEECLINTNKGAHISEMPIFPLTDAISDLLGYRLGEGLSAETAGAMLLIVDQNHYKEITDALEGYEVPWYEVGEVIEGEEKVQISPEFRFKVVEY